MINEKNLVFDSPNKSTITINKAFANEKFDFLFSCSLWGFSFFLIFAEFFIQWTSEKGQLFEIYIEGWIVSLLAGLAFGILLEFIRHLFFNKFQTFYLSFTFLNFLFLIGFLYQQSWDNFSTKNFPLLFCIIQVLAFSLNWAIHIKAKIKSYFTHKVLYTICAASFFVWLLSINPNWPEIFKGWSYLNYLFLIGILMAFHSQNYRKDEVKPNRINHEILIKYLKIFFFSGIALWIIFRIVFNPIIPYDIYHYSFYLGPLADLISGKSLLFNINAQYGVFVFYFLKQFFNFLPLGFSSFCLVIIFLYIIQYLLFYYVTRQLFKNETLPLLSLIILLLINFLGPTDPVLFFPSTGPLRFGFIYVLMALIALRNKYKKLKTIVLVIEALVIGAASFWSIEVAIYTLPAYLGLILFETINFSKKIHLYLSHFIKRIIFLILAIAFVGLYLYLDIYSRVQHLPNWKIYTDIFFWYKNGFGLLPISPLGVWWVILGTYCLSNFIILGILINPLKKRSLPENLNLIVLVNIYGIFQFFYYLGRSDPSNLFHISMPCILLIIFWLHYLNKFNLPSVPIPIKRFGKYLIILTFGFGLQPMVTHAEEKLKSEIWLDWLQTIKSIANAARDASRDDRFAKGASDLMRKIFRKSKTARLFLWRIRPSVFYVYRTVQSLSLQ